VTAAYLRTNGVVAVELGKRGLRQALRRPQFLMPLVVFPSLMLAVNTGGASRATQLPGFPQVHGFLDFELAGAMLQATMLAGVSGGIALALDFEMGFIDRLFAAPISRYTIIAGRVIGTAVMGLLTGIWFTAVGLIFGAHIEGGLLGMLMVLAVAFLAAGAFGTLGSALAISAKRASTVQGIFPLVFVILFLSSAFFPQGLLQEPAQTISSLNPLSLIADGLRTPIIDGVTAKALAKALGGIAIIAVIGLTLTALALRKRAKAG
jgi:ABC-type multidrug transport system permease subunit